jgi:hypothetical protein
VVLASCLSQEASYLREVGVCHRVPSFLVVGVVVGDLQIILLLVEVGVEEVDHRLSYHLEEGEVEEEDAYLMEEVVVVEVAFLPSPFLEVVEVEEEVQKQLGEH